ncbi:hypothetical protein LRU_01953 [Ligilactobacillus ruminis SPM0211]|uniref:Uncharacterized protein n=1 Tax=Ligilactobacillus ruminis SPM0211 TaxID=1040964 RepID=F7R2M1_9LACO|nr:hypothetical protein LRU_01953 [Ligilactobacillus ruminis SPM0211]
MRKKCNEVGEDIEKEHLLAISRMLKDPKTRCYNVLSGLPASVEKKESAFIACRFSKKRRNHLLKNAIPSDVTKYQRERPTY